VFPAREEARKLQKQKKKTYNSAALLNLEAGEKTTQGKREITIPLKKKGWLSRRQGLEKEAGLRRIPLQPASILYYNHYKKVK
jgi:hypothetical protein